MKTLKLTSYMPFVKDLLRMAQKDTVLVTTEDGDSFVISSADDFKSEEEIIPLNEVEKKLR